MTPPAATPPVSGLTDRRGFLAGSAALGGTLALGMPLGRPKAQTRVLKVGTYGGYFKDSFDAHIYPDFTAATGIEIESIAQPSGAAWLVQLETAARAGQAPADVSMMAQVPRLRGQGGELWAPLELERIPNHQYLLPHFIHTYDDGRVAGIGAVTWFITLVSNTDIFPQAPESWADMWADDKRDQLGLLALASNSFLLEITAATFFGGKDILATEEGILEVMAKIAEVKPNVKLWYRDEAQFQQMLQAGEVGMGQYYHDVAGLAAADGFPVRSTFPVEGGVNDSGSWSVSRASDAVDEAHVFIDYMCQPGIQATLARRVGTAPTVARETMDLGDEEFAAVSSAIPPIIPEYDMYLERGDWLEQQWTEMITS
jgi:putative spermidine/putrescine transport system substrate-binding protein